MKMRNTLVAGMFAVSFLPIVANAQGRVCREECVNSICKETCVERRDETIGRGDREDRKDGVLDLREEKRGPTIDLRDRLPRPNVEIEIRK